MIKTFLKHLIYETCISTFFKHVKNNFSINLNNRKVPSYMWQDYETVKSINDAGAQRAVNQFKIVAEMYEKNPIPYALKYEKEDLEYFHKKLVKFKLIHKWWPTVTNDTSELATLLSPE